MLGDELAVPLIGFKCGNSTIGIAAGNFIERSQSNFYQICADTGKTGYHCFKSPRNVVIQIVENIPLQNTKAQPVNCGRKQLRRRSPERTASIRAQQATVGAMGPTESKLLESGSTPSRGTRRAVGLNAVRPHRAPQGCATNRPCLFRLPQLPCYP